MLEKMNQEAFFPRTWEEMQRIENGGDLFIRPHHVLQQFSNGRLDGILPGYWRLVDLCGKHYAADIAVSNIMLATSLGPIELKQDSMGQGTQDRERYKSGLLIALTTIASAHGSHPVCLNTNCEDMLCKSCCTGQHCQMDTMGGESHNLHRLLEIAHTNGLGHEFVENKPGEEAITTMGALRVLLDRLK